MQFLPEDKKKRNQSIILLIVLIAGFVYINFFFGSNDVPSSSSETVLIEEEIPGSDEVSASSNAGAPVSRNLANPSSLLPYGSNLNFQILDDERFQNLVPPPEFSLSDNELGKENLFDASGPVPQSIPEN